MAGNKTICENNPIKKILGLRRIALKSCNLMDNPMANMINAKIRDTSWSIVIYSQRIEEFR